MYHLTKHSFIVYNTQKHNLLSVLFWERDKKSHPELIFSIKRQLEKHNDSLDKNNIKAIGTIYYNCSNKRTMIFCTACRQENQNEFKGRVLIQEQFEKIYYHLVKDHFTHTLNNRYLMKHVSAKNQLRPQKRAHCL